MMSKYTTGTIFYTLLLNKVTIPKKSKQKDVQEAKFEVKITKQIAYL